MWSIGESRHEPRTGTNVQGVIVFVLLILTLYTVSADTTFGGENDNLRSNTEAILFAPPTVSLISPVGGESWCIGSSHDILWFASDDAYITNIALYYSTDGGSSWIPISGTESNDGIYPWTIPSAPSTQCLVKVVAFDKTDSTEDISDSNFTIKDCQAPAVSLTAPVGGESWCIGSSHDILWSASDNIGVTNIALYYSTNGGSSWIPIDETETNDGIFPWTVPSAPSTQCRVNVIAYDEANNTAADSSDSNFTIKDCQAPTVDVTAPVGGESWYIGSSQDILWSASDDVGVTNIALYYSTDGGSNWIPIDETEPNDGVYPWVIPFTPSTQCRVKVIASDEANNAAGDSSDSNFTIYPLAGIVEVSAGGDQYGYADSTVSVVFLVENVSAFPDSYSLDISDTQSWSIEPLHYDVVLDTAQIDSVDFTVSIPYVPLGTVDELTLLAVSKTHPLARDSASLNVTCSAYVEDWDLISGGNMGGLSNSQVTVVFHVQNTGLAPDSCSLTVSDSLGWDIQPEEYSVTLNPGQQDSVFFDVQIPWSPVGTTNKLTLAGGSLTNPFVVDSASLLITCTSRIIRVPADFTTIQGAINFSSDGDSILVAPDTYYEHPDFNGKAIVLKSENGPDSTIISKLAGGVSMVRFISGEDSNSVLDGFTITGAVLEVGQGAGVKCQNSSPKIVNNRIVDNSCPYGAGIDCDNYSSPIITNNVIEQNPATSSGGGIRCNNHSSPVIRENLIIGNSAVESGGGVWCEDYCSPSIVGNLIAGNMTETGYGGGIGMLNSSVADITNNTVDANSAFTGGGIYIDATSSATIVNTLVTNTLSGKGIRYDGVSPILIYYCDVWNNLDEDYYGCLPGDGCISDDPVYCDSDNGDYSLWSGSPCLGAGQEGTDIGAFGEGCSGVGDANGDGEVNIGDVVYLVSYLYKSGPAPTPAPAGDVNCDGLINVGDVVYLVNYLFKGGPPPCEP